MANALVDAGYLTTCGPADWPMAVDWALALGNDHLPTAVIVGPSVRGVATAAELDVFDFVVDEPSGTPPGYMALMSVAEATPFRRTLFSHTDVYAFASPSRLFDRLADSGFALQGELLPPSDTSSVYGLSIDQMTKQFPAPYYLKCQSGVMYFEKNAGRSILADCKQLADGFRTDFNGIRRLIANKVLNDEWLLGIVGGRRHREIDLISYPIPMAWHNYGLTETTRRTPLLHLTTLPSASLMAGWLRRIVKNRERAGLDPQASLARWWLKLRQLAWCERDWFANRGPVAKWRRWRDWRQAVLAALQAAPTAEGMLPTYRHEAEERRHGWADGEQRTFRACPAPDSFVDSLLDDCRVDVADADVLEIGWEMQPGTRAWRQYCRWTGIDPLAKHEREAQPNVVRSVPECLPFADAAFDVVLAFDVLDRLLDLDATLAELDRVLRSGGRLVVACRVEHFPDFDESHALHWRFLRRRFPNWTWEVERQFECRDEDLDQSVRDAQPFDFTNRACRPGVLLAVGRASHGRSEP